VTITRWDPFQDLISLQERMNRLFDETLRSQVGEEEAPSASWAPVVDIYETEFAIVVKADLPEVSKADIDIKVENNVLTMRGERKLSEEIKKEDYFRMERQYGIFKRSLSLPGDIDHKGIKASHEDGVLTIEIPKQSDSKPRQIKIT
jgi:HSP20 family protein